MATKVRAIRLNDVRWKGFCELLGPEWLRVQIDKAIKKSQSESKNTQTKGTDQ